MLFRFLTRSLVLLGVLAVLPTAQAQKGEPSSEIIMIDEALPPMKAMIRYADADGPTARATVTVEAEDVKGLTLVAMANGRRYPIPLAFDDGTLTGTGTLPTLGETDELALMTRNGGLRFGVPVADPTREGWNIEQGSAWNIEEGSARKGETVVGSQRGNGWSVDIEIGTDPPVIDIVIKW